MMNPESIIYIIPYVVSIFISLGISFYAWRHRSVVGALSYSLFTMSQAYVSLLNIFEIAAGSIEMKIFWDGMQWIGYILMPIAFFIFVLEYTGQKSVNLKRAWLLLSLPAALFLLLVATNRWHGLTVEDPYLIQQNGLTLLDYKYPTAVLLIFTYLTLLNLASIVLLTYQFLRVRRVFRAQVGSILAGFTIPFISTIMTLAGITFFFQRDIIPLSLAIGNLFVAWGLFRYQLFDLRIIGRDIIIENMTDSILVLDLQNRIVDINPVFSNYLNRQKTEMIGLSTDQAFAQWPQFITKVNDLANVRTEVTLQDTHEWMTFELLFSGIYDQREQLMGRVINARDITERKRTEHRYAVLLNLAHAVTTSTNLEELVAFIHQQLGSLIDTTNFYVALYDPDTEFYSFPFWTDEYDTDEGAWGPQPLPKSYTDYVRRTGEPLFADWDLHHQLVAKGEIELIDAPSDLWLGTPLRTPEGIIGVLVVQSYENDDLYTVKDLELLAFASDTIALVIERKAKEDALEAYRNQLEELVDKRTTQLAKKNQELRREIKDRKHAQTVLRAYAKELETSNRELEDFAFISSHDLQEPLRKIQTFSDRLQSSYKDQLDERGQNYLARMQQAAVRSQKLIADLLLYSRISSSITPYTQVELSQTVEAVLHDLRLNTNSDAVVHLTPLPTIQADAAQMYQLWQNLVGNALKFHLQDSSPVVEIMVIHDETVPEGFCQILIRDNGIGFDEKYLNRIFTVFQRLHTQDEFEGTGIGLAICRRIVERHNGRIWATSSPNQGSSFFVELPLT